MVRIREISNHKEIDMKSIIHAGYRWISVDIGGCRDPSYNLFIKQYKHNGIHNLNKNLYNRSYVTMVITVINIKTFIKYK